KSPALLSSPTVTGVCCKSEAMMQDPRTSVNAGARACEGEKPQHGRDFRLKLQNWADLGCTLPTSAHRSVVRFCVPTLMPPPLARSQWWIERLTVIGHLVEMINNSSRVPARQSPLLCCGRQRLMRSSSTLTSAVINSDRPANTIRPANTTSTLKPLAARTMTTPRPSCEP